MAGTQIIDRLWREIRSELKGVSSSVDSDAIRMRVRSAQWHFWNRGEDLWLQTGADVALVLKGEWLRVSYSETRRYCCDIHVARTLVAKEPMR